MGSAFAANVSPSVPTATTTNPNQAAVQPPPPPAPTQVARPTQSQSAPQIINMPPVFTNALQPPSVNVQNKVVPPITTGNEGSTPDVSGLMDTTNPENPYIFLPFSLGIIM